ncbi:unnamed protein product [Caenorhabditis auriculariae]|uniref:microtubule-severing ATPase n=1 Tax=Caenorhabditis auriculariae TaxID=2777116 RepID=A0A8S1HBE8_9PELO|nr:unnamed protein product [Caenorhabditis auriculariae]
MLSGVHPKDHSRNEYYENFISNFNRGRELLLKAVSQEERLRSSNNSSKNAMMVETAELYKRRSEVFFKKAKEVNLMDIPHEYRNDVGEKKTLMNNYDKSAQERILAICDELGIRKSNSAPSAAAAPRSVSTPRSGVLRPVNSNKKEPVPRQRGSETTAAKKEDPKSACSRARCATRDKPVAKTTRSASATVSRAALLKGVDPKIGERLLDEVLDHTGVTMKDVAGCDSAKRALEEAVILPALNPGLFSGLRQPVKGILLFGPPGNGKTLLAKAVAGESNQMFFNISASSLTSKWVGDAEKTIRGLFQIARNAQPAIIFIDEIDSILCERNEKDSEVSRRMKTEFLVQFDGATSSSEDRILVIGATNRPYELDDAVLRRFPKRILLSLPDDSARFELIRSTLQKHDLLAGISDRDVRYIASSTRGYSNSDLVEVCREASMEPVRGLDKRTLAKVDRSKLRNLKPSDFEAALMSIKPSTSPKVMEKLVEFASRCGQSCSQ